MKTRALACLLFPLLVVCLGFQPQDRRENRNVLVVATFNAEWLFDGVDDNSRSPWRGRPNEAREHMQAVANAIREIDADIVNLVEVESLEVLNRLNDDFLADMNYNAYLVNGRDTYTGQDVGLLTRIDPEGPLMRTEERAEYPIPESTIDAADDGTTGVSKHYYAAFSFSDIELAIVGVHFLSRPTDRRNAVRREGQSEVIRGLVLEEAWREGRELIILGDFNDYDVLPDVAESQPITVVMSRLKDLEPLEPGNELTNVARRLPRSDRYSAWWDRDDDSVFEIDRGEATLIDHILLSAGLAARIDRVWFYRGFAAGEVSDHWPLVVRLDLGAENGEAIHTGVVVSNPQGEVHPLASGGATYLRLPDGIFAVFSSDVGESPEYLDLGDWLGRLVSVEGVLRDSGVYSARFAEGN